MVDGKEMKVDLWVYDNEGEEGLFVGWWGFRDLSKDVGGEIGRESIEMKREWEGVEELGLGGLEDG